MIKVEHLPPEDSEFIPEIEYDETGKKKPSQYKQRPYVPTSEFEG